MEYFSTSSAASRRASGCLIVGVYEHGKLGVAAADIDAASGGSISKLVKQGDISAAPGKCTVLTSVSDVRAQRVAVVGLGSISKFSITRYRQAIRAAMAAIKGSKTRDIVNYLTLEKVADASAYYLARYSVETIGGALYSFTEMKSERKKTTSKITRIGHAIASRSDAANSARGSEHADAIVEGMTLCRDLGNLPANVCTPSYLARTAQRLEPKSPLN
jgi:leucyl aminopeptidase